MKQAACKLCGQPFVCDNGMWFTTCTCARDRPQELKAAQESTTVAEFDKELAALRSQAQKDNLRAEDADRYEQWLVDIGRNIGCGHVDERLPSCIAEEFEKLRDENAIMRQSLKVARLTDEKYLTLLGEAHSLADFAADSLELRVGDTNIVQRLNDMAEDQTVTTDIIGGFAHASPNCRGCGKPLTVENANLTDGCPCNSPLGVNSTNETRWRLLMELQQKTQRSLEAAKSTSFAWLVELEPGKGVPQYLGIRGSFGSEPCGVPEWTTDPNNALRFARQQDAILFIGMLKNIHANLPGSWGMIGFRRHDQLPAATEHGWS